MAIPVPEKRVKDFEEMGFGMFVHWGLYALLGQGEWARYLRKIPREEYCKLADDFAVTKFDGRELARIAKRAGAKYITITTRHHDGFSLYDTKGLDTFDAPHSAAKRDLIREFVDGCNAEGIKPFFYHTKLDWNHPTYHGDFKKYLQYLRDSIEVLCTQYGEIGGFWFDGNWDRPPETDWEDDQLYALIRRYQPNCIIVDNTGLERRGAVGNKELDSVTFEQGRPTPMDREGMDKYVAAEMCQTINQHWGYGKADFNYKSLAYLIETLCACRKVGANYLLNVGPDGDGVVPAMQAELMAGIGDYSRLAELYGLTAEELAQLMGRTGGGSGGGGSGSRNPDPTKEPDESGKVNDGVAETNPYVNDETKGYSDAGNYAALAREYGLTPEELWLLIGRTGS
jgi:alpha-L-fucosidase